MNSYLQINLFRSNNFVLIPCAFFNPNVFLARSFAERAVLDRTSIFVLFESPTFLPDISYKFPFEHFTIHNKENQSLNNFPFLNQLFGFRNSGLGEKNEK